MSQLAKVGSPLALECAHDGVWLTHILKFYLQPAPVPLTCTNVVVQEDRLSLMESPVRGLIKKLLGAPGYEQEAFIGRSL